MCDGCPPAAKVFTRQMELCYVRMLFKNRMHGLSQLPDAFAMNDAHAQNSASPTLSQIIQHQVLYFPRLKRVQVQRAVNWQLDWFVVHIAI